MTALVDIERPLSLFAEGIAGRYYHLKTGDTARADAHNLYLPEQIELFEDPHMNGAAYRLIVLNQLGFREFGTYTFDDKGEVVGLSNAVAQVLPLAERTAGNSGWKILGLAPILP